jgi:acyl-CoA thioesterase
MSDLRADTALRSGGDHEWTVTLAREWEIWGPNGGYMAAIALRAAEEASGRARPANVSVHFLGVGNFDEPCEVTATVQRATRQATSVHVTIRQAGKPLLAAMVWAIDDGIDGLGHHDIDAPTDAGWHQLPTLQQRMADDPDVPPSRYRFWDNFEQRPVEWMTQQEWQRRDAAPAVYLNWLRFVDAPDRGAWAQAQRLLLLVDLGGWPAIGRRHRTEEWMAPSIDVSCEFHRLDGDDEWLLLDGASPVAEEGLVATHQRVWSEHGRLLASGISHLLCRRIV